MEVGRKAWKVILTSDRCCCVLIPYVSNNFFHHKDNPSLFFLLLLKKCFLPETYFAFLSPLLHTFHLAQEKQHKSRSIPSLPLYFTLSSTVLFLLPTTTTILLSFDHQHIERPVTHNNNNIITYLHLPTLIQRYQNGRSGYQDDNPSLSIHS